MHQLLLSCLLLAFPSPEPTDWVINFREAQTMAQSEQKAILMVFSGSDWCRPCIQMEQEVFESADFQDFARDHLVLLRIDFPRRKKNKLSPALQQHHSALAARYNPKGAFPWVVLLDEQGEILLQTGFQTGQSRTFVSQLEAVLP